MYHSERFKSISYLAGAAFGPGRSGDAGLFAGGAWKVVSFYGCVISRENPNQILRQREAIAAVMKVAK